VFYWHSQHLPGGTVSGQSSVVQLDAWNWEDAAYKKDIAIHLTGRLQRAGGGRRGAGAVPASTETPAERAQKQIDNYYSLYLRKHKVTAEDGKPTVHNLRLDAMSWLV
jgi:hypothetical protein